MDDADQPIWKYILERVPDYQSVVSALGSDFLSGPGYIAVGALYDFAVDAHTAGRDDIVTQALATVEAALQSGNAALVEPFSIDFIEALASEASKPHYRSWMQRLGASSRSDLLEKNSQEQI